jgi:hypothetical protein
MVAAHACLLGVHELMVRWSEDGASMDVLPMLEKLSSSCKCGGQVRLSLELGERENKIWRSHEELSSCCPWRGSCCRMAWELLQNGVEIGAVRHGGRLELLQALGRAAVQHMHCCPWRAAPAGRMVGDAVMVQVAWRVVRCSRDSPAEGHAQFWKE